VTTIAGRLKPELWFLPGRLRWTHLLKERYDDSLSGCGSNTQPYNWEPIYLNCWYTVAFCN